MLVEPHCSMFLSLFPNLRISTRMKNRNDRNIVRRYAIEHQVRKTPNDGHAGITMDNRIRFWMTENPLKTRVDASKKVRSQACIAGFVPVDGLH